MNRHSQYFIVDAEALPEIFLKVVEAKHCLETGESTTVNEATQQVGISRSAFYKYKDMIRPFNDMLSGRIITFQISLKNEPGALSGVLNNFAACGLNIITINQTIPSGGAAVVSIGAETSGLHMSVEEFLAAIAEEVNVIRCEVLAG